MAQATGHVMRAVRVVWEGLPWEAGLGVLASSGEERGALRGLQGSLLSVQRALVQLSSSEADLTGVF